MNILFLGGVFDNTIEKEILNKSKEFLKSRKVKESIRWKT